MPVIRVNEPDLNEHIQAPDTVMLSVVIPAYNESNNMDEVLGRLLTVKDRLIERELVRDVEIIVVNDCSADDTEVKALSYGDDVRVINHDVNKGYGAALKTGFNVAQGEWIGFLDADLTYPPESFLGLSRAMADNQADIVVGSRMMNKRTGMPIQRYVGNKMFARLLSWIMDDRITDTASGMRIFKRSILPRLRPLPDGLHLTPTMSTRALLEDLKVVETPIPYHERGGASKLNAITDGLRFLKTITATARLYRPLKFFGLAGMLLVLVGGALGTQPVLHYLSASRVEDYSIYRLFTVMVSLVIGLNLLSFGAFADKVLQVSHGRRRFSGFWERFVFTENTVEHFGTIGLVLVLSGIGLNYMTIYEYVTTLQVTIHWSYVLTGATLILCGTQLVMSSFLIQILKSITEIKRS